MMSNIKNRLIVGFLSVVLIFAIAAAIAGSNARQVASEAQLFLDEYWPTSALLMQTHIALDEIAAVIANPPSDLDPSELIDSIRKEVDRIQEEFKASGLAVADTDRIVGLLDMFKESLALPIMLHIVPAQRMEEADAAAAALLAVVESRKDATLINATWREMKNLRDLLISERRGGGKFDGRIAAIENHPDYESFRPVYEPYRRLAAQVFDSTVQLKNARAFFRTSYETLTRDFRKTGARYADTVVKPASSTIHASLGQILSTMLWAPVIGAVLSIAIGLMLARGLANPLRRVMEVIGKLEQGHLDSRTLIRRRDEVGRMSSALDRMSHKLSGMVLRIRHSGDELIGVSRNLSQAATSVDFAARHQAEGVEKATTAMRSIRQLDEQIGQGIEQLTDSAADSTSSVLEMSANIEEVAQSAESLALSVEEVNSAIQQMAAALRQSSENILTLRESSEATASSAAQMDVSIEQVEKNARNIRRITEEVRADAERGQQAVEATIHGIEVIRQSSKESGEVVLSLAGRAVDIARILAVIEEVTDQTNLLALNAAIIAAQAGERGKAFAVVADEIRDLAERTNHATREIAEVVQAVQDDAGRVVEKMQQADSRIAEGETLSLQSGKALKKIVSGVAGAASQMDQIANATHEQAQGSRLIRSSMEKMAEMVDQTAAAMLEQEKAGQAIRAAAESMWERTNQVKNSTREQSNAAKTIARSTENINEQVQRIMAACEQQGRQGKEVDGAVAQIRTTARDNLEFVQLLNQAVQVMTAQVEILQKEMTMFKGLNEDQG